MPGTWLSPGARPGFSRTANGADLSAASAARVKEVRPVGLQPAHADAARHLQPLQHGTAFWVDPPDIALVVFPCAVPQLAVDPGHAGNEAVGLDGPFDHTGSGIDLVDF